MAQLRTAKISTPQLIPKLYHHKDLRESLLQAAVQLIAEVGLAGFTLREVARRAGVSHNAPYRHFRDRGQLLREVADQGFQELTQAMFLASSLPTAPLGRLHASGQAYVEFALRRPEHFSAMFESPIDECNLTGDSQSGSEAFSLLVALVQACQEAGLLNHGDAHQLALVNWAMMHGIAKLAIARRLPGESTEDVLTFVKFVAEHCLVTH